MSNSPRVVIGLCNPKSPSNVGAVMRAVGCYQADAVRYTGVRLDRAAKYCTDTKDINDKLPLSHVDDLLGGLPSDISVVCVELVEGATLLPEFVHPESALYVFGPEDGSLPQNIIDQANYVVYVPTIGCMNLAASVNVLLYDRMSKGDLSFDLEKRIKASRDTNNRLLVKSKR